MLGQTVNDILTLYRPEANRLGFRRMTRSLGAEVARAWKDQSDLKISDTRYEAAIRHVALIQTYQQLGQYDAAKRSWNRLQNCLEISGNIPDSLRRVLGEEVGDHAATVFFHLNLAKSEFNTAGCQRHLDDALSHLKRPSNRAEFYWRHCVNKLVSGQGLDFADDRERYLNLTQDENPLVARANMHTVESTRQSLIACNTRPDRLQHAEDALWLFLEATAHSDALLDHLDQPNLTTHSILSGARQKILLRRRIDFLNCKNDRETEYRRCLKLIHRLMHTTGIDPNADGFRENAVAHRNFLHECLPHEPTTPAIDTAWLVRHDRGDRATRLARIIALTQSLL